MSASPHGYLRPTPTHAVHTDPQPIIRRQYAASRKAAGNAPRRIADEIAPRLHGFSLNLPCSERILASGLPTAMSPSGISVVFSAVVCLIAAGLSGCATSLQSQGPPPSNWSVGFWYWGSDGESPLPAQAKPQAVYFHAGTINAPYRPGVPWSLFGSVPDRLPPASAYWLLFRMEGHEVPDTAAAENISREISATRREALLSNLNVRGVQLDVDSPTKSLSQYAEFIRVLRNRLPAGTQISITALLDWFRDGTDIGKVINQVDEFVPQFYDVAPGESRKAIATAFDATLWASKFNRFHKPYRIGLATFGRGRIEVKGASASGYYRDIRPSDLAGNTAFRLNASHSGVDELVLRYEAIREVKIGYQTFQPGDFAEFVMSTNAEVKSAVRAARAIGGYCAGVVFFRWPEQNEVLAMDPDVVMSAAGFGPPESTPAISVHQVDGYCAAVSCTDIFVLNRRPLLSHEARYRILSSGEIDYFVPSEGGRARMVDPTHLDFDVPPYGGEGRTYLGRAVSRTKVTFEVEH
jgi:hypothetical protein